MKPIPLVLLAILATVSMAGAEALAQVKPEFQLGFRLLADQIPEVVGEPLETEHWGVTGDSLQGTSKGLMVWRKADNWTAFTDGDRTWVNGPNGLEARANGERFPWERDTTPATLPSAVPDDEMVVPITPDNVDRVAVLRSLQHAGPEGSPQRVDSVAFSPDGRLLASAGSAVPFEPDPSLKLWEVASGREVFTLSGHKGWIQKVVFSPDGQLLASAGTDGTVRLWEVSSGRQIRSMSWPTWIWADSVAFSPDGRLLGSGSSNGTVKLWEVSSGQELRTLGDPTWSWMFGVAFSPDGRLVASGNWDGDVKVWDVATRRQTLNFRHIWQVREVAFSPDGRLLATGSRQGTVKLWEVAGGREVRTLNHENRVYSIAFSPDGRVLASGSGSSPGGNALYLWDVASGRQLRSLSGPKYWVNQVTFSADGSLVASGGPGGEIKLWGLR